MADFIDVQSGANEIFSKCTSLLWCPLWVSNKNVEPHIRRFTASSDHIDTCTTTCASTATASATSVEVSASKFNEYLNKSAIPYKFTLIFEGLPKSCIQFDLIEIGLGEGCFEFKNIMRNQSDVYYVESNENY